MQIFCDESGGTDPANDAFLVAAVVISGTNAARLLKSFRKAVSWKGVEIKGHTLHQEQRRILFDLIDRDVDFRSIVVSCRRHDGLGGWAMKALPEITLYGHLLSEACMGVAELGSEPLTITADGGRYKRASLRTIGGDLLSAAADLNMDRSRMIATFQNSASIPGLQIADVIANTAFQALGSASVAAHAAVLLRPLQSSGRLLLRPAALVGCRPTWLEGS